MSLSDDRTDRVNQWELPTRTLKFGPRPILMGIVNVTPDSFSDGGSFLDPTRAVAHGEKLVRQGADLLDIGGESTRPYSATVLPTEELQRVLPVIEGLRAAVDVPLSIDTSKPEVAQEALAAGVEIVNDVTGMTNQRMIEVALEKKAAVCAMHMQGTPQTMQDDPCYENVVEDVFEFLRLRRDTLQKKGFVTARICLDPGIGFGKSHQHNLTLLEHCARFHDLGCPVLVGHSRKGFIGKILGDKEKDRTAGTIGVALALARQGIQVIRVHDVGPVWEALQLFEAAGGLSGSRRDHE
ncbi:MAG: dihydropteroate synthase [Pirellulaceae bacterium]|nr:dihydropteroate synthase [Pirellulaceae bacterium]